MQEMIPEEIINEYNRISKKERVYVFFNAITDEYFISYFSEKYYTNLLVYRII
jgi:hypothetical protein